ncbi:MAG: VanZ family protein [Pleomorphochaeta sp.]
MENRNKLEKFLSHISIVGVGISIILIVLISYLSLISSDRLSAINYLPFGDKGAHMIAYATLGVFLYFAFVRLAFNKHHENRDLFESNWIVLPWVFTLVVGVTIGTIIEFIQKTVGRQFEVLDIISDGLGLLVGCAIGFYILKLFLRIIIKEDSSNE